MLAEKMAEWQQEELNEPDEKKKVLIPGPKQSEQLEQKASDTFPDRVKRMYAEPIATLWALGAENGQELETISRKYKSP